MLSSAPLAAPACNVTERGSRCSAVASEIDFETLTFCAQPRYMCSLFSAPPCGFSAVRSIVSSWLGLLPLFQLGGWCLGTAFLVRFIQAERVL